MWCTGWDVLILLMDGAAMALSAWSLVTCAKVGRDLRKRYGRVRPGRTWRRPSGRKGDR